MKIKASSFCSLLAFFVFVAVSVIYFYSFSLGVVREDDQTIIRGAVNAHDHFVYVDTIYRLEDEGFEYEPNNDVGIAYLYIFIKYFFGGAEDGAYETLALWVNVFFLALSFIFYVKICNYYNFGVWAKIAFLVGLHLVYFVQLINKDMMTVFIIIFSIYCAINRRILALVALLPFAFLVRQQLLVYIALFVFLQTAVFPVSRLLFSYIVTSLMAAYLVSFMDIIGAESLEDGFSAFVFEVNRSYYVGYLIFNPVRIVQFVQDAFSSFLFVLPDGSIDMAKLLRVPQLLLIAMLGKSLYISLKFTSYGMRDVSRPLYCALFSYLLAWLMNPTINARYVMLITPVIILLALYARRNYYVVRLNRV